MYGLDLFSGVQLWKLSFAGDGISVPVISTAGTILLGVSLSPPNDQHILYVIGCCSGNGKCEDNTCNCNTYWHGDQCEFFCNDTKCAEDKSGRGVCTDNGQCLCEDNFYPSDTCTVFCNSTDCSVLRGSNAFCNETGSCECTSGYYTEKCNVYCDVSSCSNNGHCNQNGMCDCFEGSDFLAWKIGGYTGSTCNQSVFPWPVVILFGIVLIIIIIIAVVAVIIFLRNKRNRKHTSDGYQPLEVQ